MYFDILDNLSKNRYTNDELVTIEKELRKRIFPEKQKEKKNSGQD